MDDVFGFLCLVILAIFFTALIKDWWTDDRRNR